MHAKSPPSQHDSTHFSSHSSELGHGHGRPGTGGVPGLSCLVLSCLVYLCAAVRGHVTAHSYTTRTALAILDESTSLMDGPRAVRVRV
ncbi:hypothetical protein BDW22DRAFT_1357721 [Trametopsis cervina]|nr:hypothetical protein BDW22DRAFT_1357721 [Trametopsis cervina]